MTDFEDLLGGGTPEPVKRRPGRPTREEAAARAAQQAAAEREERTKIEGFYASPEGRRLVAAASTGRTAIEERELHVPCSINFLARVMRLDPMTVNKRLRKVNPVGYAGSGANKRALYDFADTLPYLLKPKMDIGTYIRTLNTADMPQAISKAYWEAERIKNNVLLETAEAWPTEAVLTVFNQAGMMIKDRIPLINDGMKDLGLNEAQMNKLRELCDQFQADVHAALVDLPKKQKTPSRLAEIDMGIEEFDDGDGE